MPTQLAWSFSYLPRLVQESAVANVKSLDELLKWVGKRSGARGVAGQVRATFDIHRLWLHMTFHAFNV